MQRSNNVPKDGSCLFWSVTLAYLKPKTDDEEEFKQRSEKLFSTDNLPQNLFNLIKNYDPLSEENCSLNPLNIFVTQIFRSKIVQFMRENEDKYKEFINDEFEKHLQNMSKSEAWGGEPEIRAMADFLECKIEVRKDEEEVDFSSYGSGNTVIHLFHVNGNHYEFGILSDHDKKTQLRESQEFKPQDHTESRHDSSLSTNEVRKSKASTNGQENEPKQPKDSFRTRKPSEKTSTDDQENEPKQPNDTGSKNSSRKRKSSTVGQENVPKQPKNDANDQSSSESVCKNSKRKHGVEATDKPVYPKKQLDLQYINEKVPSGLKTSLHGPIFQLKLLILFITKAAKEGLDFGIATELNKAEKFDDLVFAEKFKDKKRLLFLQAKHKQNENEILKSSDLESEKGPFGVRKYFDSYRKITLKDEFKSFEKGYFVLCTNAKLDELENQTKKVERSELPFLDVDKATVFSRLKYPPLSDSKKISRKLTDKALKSSLPDDTITPDEIQDFEEKFVLVTSFPNEQKLGNRIDQELNDLLENCNTTFIFDSLFQRILDWFKQRESTFLHAKEANELIDTIKSQICALSLVSSTETFVKPFTKGNRFKTEKLKDLKEHLKKSQRILLHGQNVFLVCLQVHQIVKEKNENLVFNEAQVFLENDKLKKFLISAFKTTDTIILSCESKFDKFNELIRVLENSSGGESKKQLIVITNKSGKEQIRVENQNCFEVTGLDFENLEQSSQDNILKTKVKFQDRMVELRKIIGNSCLDEIIDPQTLEAFIKSESVEIGNPLSLSREYDPKFYIDRHFQLPLLKATVLSATPEKTDIFTFSEDEFKQACDSSEEKNVHLISKLSCDCREHQTYFGGKTSETFYAWKKTKGSISKAMNYKSDEKLCANLVPKEIDLFGSEVCQKFFLVSDTAGMGKSTLMSSLASQCKEKFSNYWIIRIDLNAHSKFFNDLTENSPKDGADLMVELIQSNSQQELKTQFEKTVLKIQLSKVGNIALFFDGFDEISPDYEKKFLGLLEKLKKSACSRIFVTTRPYKVESLEKQTGVLAHHLQMFSKTEQKDFLTKYWKNVSEVDIDQLLTKISKSISDHDREMTGIPLQLRMVAEVYEDDFKNNQTPENFDLIHLYEKFIQKKFEIFRKEKQGIDPTNVAIKDEEHEKFESFQEKHELLALLRILGKVKFDSIFQHRKQEKVSRMLKEIEEGRQKSGLIDNVANGSPNFIHLTFAEYLSANYLTKKEIDLNKCHEVFMTDEYKNLRYFLEKILHKEKKKICSSEKFVESVKKHPILNKSIIEGHFKIGSFLIDNGAEVNVEDEDGYTPLILASENGHTEICQLLVKNSASVNAIDIFDSTPLHYAAKKGHINVCRLLIDKGAEVNVEDEEGDTPLILASTYGHDEICQLLVKNSASVNAIDIFATTPLHFAAQKGHINVCRFLIDKGAEVNVEDNYGDTPLILASENGHNEICQLLVENSASVNAIDIFDSTPLHYAAQKGHINVCNFLIDNGAEVNVEDENGDTPLILASTYGHNEICQLLVEKSPSVNAKNIRGRTPLHYAAQKGHINFCSFLIGKGAEVNVEDKDGYTPLILASRNGHNEICQLLIESGARK